MHTVECNKKTYTPSKVICVGKNFEAHIAEMGGARIPTHPSIFFKPNSAIAWGSEEVVIPAELGLLHHEVELSFLVGKTAKRIRQARSPSRREMSSCAVRPLGWMR